MFEQLFGFLSTKTNPKGQRNCFEEEERCHNVPRRQPSSQVRLRDKLMRCTDSWPHQAKAPHASLIHSSPRHGWHWPQCGSHGKVRSRLLCYGPWPFRFMCASCSKQLSNGPKVRDTNLTTLSFPHMLFVVFLPGKDCFYLLSVLHFWTWQRFRLLFWNAVETSYAENVTPGGEGKCLLSFTHPLSELTTTDL